MWGEKPKTNQNVLPPERQLIQKLLLVIENKGKGNKRAEEMFTKRSVSVVTKSDLFTQPSYAALKIRLKTCLENLFNSTISLVR